MSVRGYDTIPEGHKIGTICKNAGVTPRTVRYYEEQGLISPCGTAEGGHKYYAESTADLIVAIQALQEAGFSLLEIKELLDLTKSQKTENRWLSNQLRQSIIELEENLHQRMSAIQGAHAKVAAIAKATINCEACEGKNCASCGNLKKLRTLGLLAECPDGAEK